MRNFFFGSLLAVSAMTAIGGTAAFAASSNAMTTPGHAGSLTTTSTIYTVPQAQVDQLTNPAVRKAGYWTPYGYVVTCGWVYTVYGPARVCG
jgi:hypothetical protein